MYEVVNVKGILSHLLNEHFSPLFGTVDHVVVATRAHVPVAFVGLAHRVQCTTEVSLLSRTFGCVSFFCTSLSWNLRAGGRASEKGFAPGIARAKTTNGLLREGLSRR